MGSIRGASSISSSLPLSGRRMLDEITGNFVWSDGTLQYYLGGTGTLSFDPEFRAFYDGGPFDFYRDGSFADSAYAYGGLTVRAFDMIDSVIQTDFVQLSDANTARSQADLVMITSDDRDENLEGFFTFPNFATRAPGDYWSFGTITSDLFYMNVQAEFGGGSYVNWTLLHEIGHGIGLLHSFDDSDLGPLPNLGPNLDNERYTVMSYDASSNANGYGHAVSLMALDIAALQQQYGAETYANGASTYRLADARGGGLRLNEGNVQIGRAYFSIWDSGGTDVMIYDGANSVLLNLNDATLDNSRIADDVSPSLTALQYTDRFDQLSEDLRNETVDDDFHAGGFFSRVLIRSGGQYSGIDGGFSIANGAEIENAEGGNNDDILIGNELVNILNGGSGDDVMVGGRGDDVLNGAAGQDVAAFSAGRGGYDISYTLDGRVSLSHSGVDGADLLSSVELLRFSDQLLDLTTQALEITGGDGNDTMAGGMGNDRLDGADGDDTISGGNGTDTLLGGTGNDRIIGGSAEDDLRDLVLAGAGDDIVDGGYGNDELRGETGNDTMEGGFGVDTVIGGDGDDVLTGSAFSDLVFGGDGLDFINGGFGSDRVNGGDGGDRFYHVGLLGHGSDWVQDFDGAEGDALRYGGTATADQFQVNVANTIGAGRADIAEAFVIYKPTGQILWALVDGDGQDEIRLFVTGDAFDLLV